MQTANDNSIQSSALQIGETRECGSVRIHRYRDSIRITDLKFAGKRGKKCCELAVCASLNGIALAALDQLSSTLITRSNFSAMAVDVETYCELYPNAFSVYDETKRGVDVHPAGSGKLEISGAHVHISCDIDTFCVSDKDDRANEPCAIQPTRGAVKTHVKRFRAWVERSRCFFESATFVEVTRAMRAAEIDYHYFCAVD